MSRDDGEILGIAAGAVWEQNSNDCSIVPETENWRGSSMNVTAVLDRYPIGGDANSTTRSPTMLRTRPTPTDNRQRRSGCERTNGNYLTYSNRPKQLAKQSACACISTEPRPGRLRLLPFERLAS